MKLKYLLQWNNCYKIQVENYKVIKENYKKRNESLTKILLLIFILKTLYLQNKHHNQEKWFWLVIIFVPPKVRQINIISLVRDFRNKSENPQSV
jgi:hypothetical protein